MVNLNKSINSSMFHGFQWFQWFHVPLISGFHLWWAMPPRKISPWRAKPTLAHHSLAPWRHVVDSLSPVSTDWLLTRSILDGYKLILTSLLVSIWEYPLTSNDFFCRVSKIGNVSNNGWYFPNNQWFYIKNVISDFIWKIEIVVSCVFNFGTIFGIMVPMTSISRSIDWMASFILTSPN